MCVTWAMRPSTIGLDVVWSAMMSSECCWAAARRLGEGLVHRMQEARLVGRAPEHVARNFAAGLVKFPSPGI
jgi:hypothetical protein